MCAAWPAVWLAVCSLMLVVTEPSTSAPEEIEAGFDINNARTELVDGVYLVDADISFVFSEEALEAIENGVPVDHHRRHAGAARARNHLGQSVVGRDHRRAAGEAAHRDTPRSTTPISFAT